MEELKVLIENGFIRMEYVINRVNSNGKHIQVIERKIFEDARLANNHLIELLKNNPIIQKKIDLSKIGC